MMYRSIVICPRCAVKSCRLAYYNTGYEVISNDWCPMHLAYEFDNEGNMRVIKIIEGE